MSTNRQPYETIETTHGPIGYRRVEDIVSFQAIEDAKTLRLNREQRAHKVRRQAVAALAAEPKRMKGVNHFRIFCSDGWEV